MAFDLLSQQFKNANMNVSYQIRNFPFGKLIDKNLIPKYELVKVEVNPL